MLSRRILRGAPQMKLAIVFIKGFPDVFIAPPGGRLRRAS
jgi:hypothetical protein